MKSNVVKIALSLTDGRLEAADAVLFDGLPASARLLPDATGAGAFLALESGLPPAARFLLPLGRLGAGVRRWAAAQRRVPYWMHPAWGAADAALPPEVQALWLELADGRVAFVAPLLDGPWRVSLEGAEGGLRAVAESGDPALRGSAATALFVAVGDDLGALMAAAARAVARHLGGLRLRADKPLPAFVERFGWCTWDAFYQEVDEPKVRAGLEAWRAAGLVPPLLILDDGWQSERQVDGVDRRLTALAPNAKFGGDLAGLVRTAKEDFGVRTVLVWHAVFGYWGGLDPALARYDVRLAERRSSPGLVAQSPGVDAWFGTTIGVPAADRLDLFYHDYHRQLARMGVDGVKVDTQAAVECVAAGQGGRVALMGRVREALEGSVQVHFGGNLINCMSCSNDMLYQTTASTVTRTSDDFWPKKPETHGLHLAANALVALWFGEFVHPDWDMFHSAHPSAELHGAGRALSGGPVYVSDKPGVHDLAVIRKLVCADGTVARCRRPGRVARQSLFTDACAGAGALVVENATAVGGVLGVFNVRHGAPAGATVAARVGAADVPGLAGRPCRLWLHRAARLEPADHVDLALAEGGSEVVTVAPVEDGLAWIGLLRLFCPGAGLDAAGADGARRWVAVRDAGTVGWWSAAPARRASVDGRELAVVRGADGLSRVELVAPGRLVVEL